MTQQHKDILELMKKWFHIADRNLTLAKKIMEIRYPDDWYEPTLEETQKAFSIALKIKKIVLEKLPAK